MDGEDVDDEDNTGTWDERTIRPERATKDALRLLRSYSSWEPLKPRPNQHEHKVIDQVRSEKAEKAEAVKEFIALLKREMGFMPIAERGDDMQGLET